MKTTNQQRGFSLLLRIVCLLLALMLLTPALFACSEPDAGDEGSGTTTAGGTTGGEAGGENGNGGGIVAVPPDPDQFTDKLILAQNGLALATVVYAPDTIQAIKNAGGRLIEAVTEVTGATLPVAEAPSGDADKVEILVGDVDCEEVRAVKAEGALSENEYIIKTVGNKIVILGGMPADLFRALDIFYQRVMGANPTYATAYCDPDVSYLRDNDTVYPAVELVSKEETLLTFTVAPGTEQETFARLSYTGNKGWRIQTKRTLSEDFDDIGASQYLSKTLGEEPVLVRETLSYKEEAHRLVVTEAGGTQVILNLNTFGILILNAKGVIAHEVTELYSDYQVSRIQTKLDATEAIFGSGSRATAANQRGRRLSLYTADLWDKEGQCYVMIPLFCSSRGTGIFVNRYEYMVTDIGNANRNQHTTTITEAGMDCYLFATEQIEDVIYGYSAISGFASQPEEWTYGMLVNRYAPDHMTYEGAMAAVQKMEEYELPWTAIIIEGWYYYKDTTGLKELCEYVHSLGKKVMCYARMGDYRYGDSAKSNYMYWLDENERKQYFFPLSSGASNPDNVNANGDAWAYVDITNPAIRDWFFTEVWDELSYEYGLDGAKIDFCEQLTEKNEIFCYDETLSTNTAHHWYPTFYNCNYWKMISSKPDGGLNFSRGGGIGSQRNPVMWGGDQTRQYDRLQWQINLMLSAGLSGIPFMSFDMSGYQYSGGKPSEIDYEASVFVRGAQFSAFTATMQTMGKVLKPYDFAEYDDGNGNHPYAWATELYRAYTRLHEVLTPYITELYGEACADGSPITRHLVLGWQGDTNVYSINDEYMFGDAFLVAPELNGKTSRDIYLPEGKWEDVNTGEVYTVGKEGKWLKGYSVAMTELPLFYNLESDSTVAKELLPSIREILDFARTIDC